MFRCGPGPPAFPACNRLQQRPSTHRFREARGSRSRGYRYPDKVAVARTGRVVRVVVENQARPRPAVPVRFRNGATVVTPQPRAEVREKVIVEPRRTERVETEVVPEKRMEVKVRAERKSKEDDNQR